MSIELPKDADGREIPLDTVLAYEPVHCPKCGEKIERRR